MKKIIIAVDSFKGSLSSSQVSAAILKAFKEIDKNIEIKLFPISDGGDGMTSVIYNNIGGDIIRVKTVNPLFRPINISILNYNGTIIMDMASCSGLTLLSHKERNAMNTTTYGVGIVILDAIKKGYNKFLIGIGGSATNDAGLGMLQALGCKIYDKKGSIISSPITGSMLKDVKNIDLAGLKKNISNINITVASDVKNVFCGLDGAAYVYAPQKGADPSEVKFLDEGLSHINDLSKKQFGIDLNAIQGAGAAGGLGGAFIIMGSKIISGIDCILDILHFDDFILGCDLIISGEGSIDDQSFMGKAISGIWSRAKENSIPMLLVAGHIDNYKSLKQIGVFDCIETSPRNCSLLENMRSDIAFKNIYMSVKQWLVKNKDIL